jgi:hypothetical protein
VSLINSANETSPGATLGRLRERMKDPVEAISIIPENRGFLREAEALIDPK